MIVLLALGCVPHLPEETVADLMSGAHLESQLGMTVHTLDNGLTVYLSENHEDARIEARVVVRAGSGQNPEAATGLAHYLEHLLFNGSEKLGTLDYAAESPHLDRIRSLYEQLAQTDDPTEAAVLYAELDAAGLAANAYYVHNELSQLYQRIGARGLNAFTAQDSTVFTVDIPSDALALWATVESDRLSAPVLRTFQTEVEVVYEERNRADDNPDRAIYHSAYAAAFPGHPYGRPSLGTIAHLKKPSVAQAEAFFEAWYVPNNMAIVLAGDFDSEAALSLIEAHFGRWEPGALPEPAPNAARPAQTERIEIQHHGEELVTMLWPSVPYSHPDHPALELATVALDHVSFHGVIDTIASPGDDAYLWPQRLGSAVWFQGWADKRHGVEQVERQMSRKLGRLHRRKVSKEVLTEHLLSERLDELRALEHNALRARWMSEHFIHGVDPVEYRQRLGAVTPREVREAARTYLSEGHVVVVRRQGEPTLPEISAPPLTPRPVNTTDHSAFFTELLETERPPLAPQALAAGRDYERHALQGGALYVARNPYNELASLTLTWDTSTDAVTQRCTALKLWNQKGFVAWDEEGFHTSVRCDARSVTVTFSGHEALLAEWVRRDLGGLRRPHPALWEEGQWMRRRLFQQAQRNTELEERARALFAYALSGRESLFCQLLDPGTLKGLSNRAYRQALRGLLDLPFDALYVGNADISSVKAMLPEPASTSRPERARAALVHPTADRTLFVQHDSVQAVLQIVIPEGQRAEADQAVAQVASRYLNDLLNHEVREARGLAYVARGGQRQGYWAGDDSYAWARAEVQADKAAEAAQLMVALLRGGTVDPARFAQARSSVAAQQRAHRTGFRGVPTVAWRMHEQGQPADARARLVSEVEALTAADLQRYLDRWSDTPLTLAIVGDRERLDMAAIAALAPIEELAPDDIFSLSGQDTGPSRKDSL